MITKSTKAVPLLVAASIGLAACEEGQFLTPPTDGDEATVAAPAEPRVEIQEVERADIFSTTELALWDGRPSLGGLWVAHPDVKDPERVLIRNTTNGRTTFGALFRRERNNPGPRIQVSSDAAAELNVLAGQPTELSIVVIRREEITIEPEPLPITESEDLPETEELNENTDDQESAAVNIDDETLTEEEPPKRQGFFARLFGGGAAADEAVEDEAVSDDASAPDVEIAPLDPITTSAAAAIDAAEAAASAPSSVRPVARATVAAVPTPAPAPAEETEPEPVVVAAPTPAPEPTPAPTPAPASLNNPFVQVGLFSVEANASAAASSLRQGGIVPTVVPGTNANGTFWRVLVGPMTSPDDQAEILGQVKALGYADAFLVSN